MSIAGNPKKGKAHILIYAGAFSGLTNKNRELIDQSIYPDLALSLYTILEKDSINSILYTDNDTVHYETMEQVIFVGDSKKINFESMQKKALKYNISFITLANKTNVENYCSFLRQRNSSV